MRQLYAGSIEVSIASSQAFPKLRQSSAILQPGLRSETSAKWAIGQDHQPTDLAVPIRAKVQPVGKNLSIQLRSWVKIVAA